MHFRVEGIFRLRMFFGSDCLVGLRVFFRVEGIAAFNLLKC